MAITDYPVSPLQALREDGAGFLVPMWPDLVDLRRHEAPALWVDNGSTYFATVPAFRATRNFHSAGLRGYPMPRERSVDINDPTDLELARYWAERLGA
jgi:CMP-N-acetylneuraminic acid synthetase